MVNVCYDRKISCDEFAFPGQIVSVFVVEEPKRRFEIFFEDGSVVLLDSKSEHDNPYTHFFDFKTKGNENYVISTKKSETEWECKFKSKSDQNANITVNVFAADYCLRK